MTIALAARAGSALLAFLLSAVALLGPVTDARAAPSAVHVYSAAWTASPGPATAAADTPPTSAQVSGRAWPVAGPDGGRATLLRRFDAPAQPWAAGHRGVDLAAAPGAEVRAAAPGVVAFSGLVGGRPVVTVSHPGSGTPPLRTTYLPVAGTAEVGTPVAAGQVIGRLAPPTADGSTGTSATGHCPESCLHWGLLRADRYLDPLALLGAGTARLLPLSRATAAPGE
ncbi:M23 family metallopeptidase [Kitasatospora sp. NPDC004240]